MPAQQQRGVCWLCCPESRATRLIKAVVERERERDRTVLVYGFLTPTGNIYCAPLSSFLSLDEVLMHVGHKET